MHTWGTSASGVGHGRRPRGWGSEACKYSPSHRVSAKQFEALSRCLWIPVSNFLIEKRCRGEWRYHHSLESAFRFATLRTLPGPLFSPVLQFLHPRSRREVGRVFSPGLGDVLRAPSLHLAVIRCPRSSAGSGSAFGIFLLQTHGLENNCPRFRVPSRCPPVELVCPRVFRGDTNHPINRPLGGVPCRPV